ncbi:NAD(P)H-dependent oxidoreductase [Piscinibacter sp. XHJ-5]|uniref:NAD(P)H-dependent oxidoreductase n=1 Tax=Piscinibacter sp. XHJ-5 TaxID=3037797 RepID=UPI0024528839|nr:NAD(P)H-dependent oxidoreductase [Piscinibacter sp. XHJ-5]
MTRRILVLQAHPDSSQPHFCHALARAYADAARAAGHEVRCIEVASIDFPLLRSKAQWDNDPVPPALEAVQADIRWCDHLVFFFPLWLGGMPALLKGFLEQVARPGFAIAPFSEGHLPKKLLAGRSGRVVVTMGMPALVYRWIFRAHSLKALERNILGFVGIAPVHETLIGSVEGLTPAQREGWLRKLAALGKAAR